MVLYLLDQNFLKDTVLHLLSVRSDALPWVFLFHTLSVSCDGVRAAAADQHQSHHPPPPPSAAPSEESLHYCLSQQDTRGPVPGVETGPSLVFGAGPTFCCLLSVPQ